jgi:inosine-uridine nucleoside N-ribohydrolase
MPRKIIIDTDPGVDDTMAIFFALRSPELEVIGLTSVFGNVAVEMATTNALRLLEIADRVDIPVARGSANPLASAFGGPVPHIHGEDGQGNVFLPPPTTRAVDRTAAEFIIDQVMAAPGEITLVPIGPLTNIALALFLEPRLVENVREIVLMGGNALVPGNATPAAEANIFNDPEAADVVFSAGWPVTMVGLDVTHQVNMTSAHLARYGRAANPLAQHIARVVAFYHNFFKRYYHDSLDGIYVHDSTAIAYLIDPSLFTIERWPVVVETMGLSRGKTWPFTEAASDIDCPPPWCDRPRISVCVGVDGEAVTALELGRLT